MQRAPRSTPRASGDGRRRPARGRGPRDARRRRTCARERHRDARRAAAAAAAATTAGLGAEATAAIAARAVLTAALDHALPAVARASPTRSTRCRRGRRAPRRARAARVGVPPRGRRGARAPAPAPVRALAPAPARRGTPVAHELDDASLDDGAEDADDDALAELGLGARYLVWANSRRGDAGLVYPAAYAPPSPQRSARPSSGRLARARVRISRGCPVQRGRRWPRLDCYADPIASTAARASASRAAVVSRPSARGGASSGLVSTVKRRRSSAARVGGPCRA